MPSTYAHYLFGENVAGSLTGSLAEKVAHNRQLFYIGLHGPDILFYYKPLSKNKVNSLGYAMHEQPAADFFKRAADMLELPCDKDASVAYLAGFVCHYALDKACHGYIEKKIQVSGISHSEIENELDRFLINYSGKSLRHTDLTAHIAATDKNAAVIAPFFKDVMPQQVKSALKSMKFYNGLLIGNRAYKRFLVNFSLAVSGKYKKLKCMLMHKKPLKGCEDSNKRLFELFTGAIGDCVALENTFYGFINGKNNLDERFNFTFGAGDNWQDIPV
ncbi:MAG: zinc dependent phospholipase C family protein [Clostridia bacterium]|nr:zinc dependent phospholipase C family protein [Clostridia bacterium]